MGCHLLDVVFWGLELGEAKSFTVEAESTGISDETYPTASTIRYRFPARGDLPPVEITWYDGGRQPARPDGLPHLRELGSNGTLFVGDEGAGHLRGDEDGLDTLCSGEHVVELDVVHPGNAEGVGHADLFQGLAHQPCGRFSHGL